MALTDSQAIILNAAMNYADGVVCLPKNKDADMRAFSSSVLSLEKKGFLERTGLTGDPKTYILNSATPRCSFKITTAGQLVLNASPEDDAKPNGAAEPMAKSVGAAAAPKAKKAKAERPSKAKAKAEKKARPKKSDDPDYVPPAKRGVMVVDYHKEYMANGGGCGDNVDETMREAFNSESTEKTKSGKTKKVVRTDEAEMEKWGRKIGLWKDGWSSLNVGMKRMNLANRVRGAIRKGTKITLRGTVLEVEAE